MGLDFLKIDVTSSVDSDLAIQAGQLSKLPVEPKIFSDMVELGQPGARARLSGAYRFNS